MALEKAKTAWHLLKNVQKIHVPKGNKGSVIRDTPLVNIDMILLYFLNLGKL